MFNLFRENWFSPSIFWLQHLYRVLHLWNLIWNRNTISTHSWRANIQSGLTHKSGVKTGRVAQLTNSPHSAVDVLQAEWPNQQRAHIVLPHCTMRSWQTGLSSRFALIMYWAYIVSALITWLYEGKYFDLTFAWLEVGFQLVLINANQEMLFNHT